MPYDNPAQPRAIFLSLLRKKGRRAAEAFGRKHREDFQRPYRPKNRRTK